MENNDKYIGTLLDDRYEILQVIGEGGMAIVYKALDHRLNRNVAVKIMREDMLADEEFRSRFCAEAHAVAMLSHPNIVAVYDVSHSDAMEYIVMELVEGITLRQYMDRRGALAWREVLHFTKQIAKAIAHAHERGIIHRDIKPQNVMMLRDGTVKVADFGIAALENEIYENNGQAVGSIHYIAPEQARVILISDDRKPYAEEVLRTLKDAGLRASLDDRNEKLGFKIREAQLEKLPYMLIVGGKEAENGTVGVRSRKEGDLGAMTPGAFIEKAAEEIRTKAR